jgi:hypothetical protein
MKIANRRWHLLFSVGFSWLCSAIFPLASFAIEAESKITQPRVQLEPAQEQPLVADGLADSIPLDVVQVKTNAEIDQEMNSEAFVQQQIEVDAATLEWSNLSLSNLSLGASPALDQLILPSLQSLPQSDTELAASEPIPSELHTPPEFKPAALASSSKRSETASSDLAESPKPVLAPPPLDIQVSTNAVDLAGTSDELTPINSSDWSLLVAELAQTPEATPRTETVPASEGSGLAQQAQNPIANLISVPFQNNVNFNVGPFDQTQNILNIQPVIPVKLSEDWLLVSRIITPVILQPTVDVDAATGTIEPGSSEFGLGDINPSFFFVPQTNSNITWGVGSVLVLPTATDEALGTERWSAGPTGVVVVTNGNWIYSVLVSQLWSFAGNEDRPEISTFIVQPSIGYTLSDGWSIGSGPAINANWNAIDREDVWTVPVGLTVSKLVAFGKQPVQFTLGGFYNVVRPNAAADWTLRFATTLLFPTGGQ